MTGITDNLRADESPSACYLHNRLAAMEARVRSAVERRRAEDPDPDDRFRGLYITDAQVDDLLAGIGLPQWAALDESASEFSAEVEAEADAAEAAGLDIRLRRLARSFGLDRWEVEILLVAMAPDLDPRFERLYGYLHDDVSRRRASCGLALELCGSARPWGEGRKRLSPTSLLVANHLVLVEEPERPYLTRSLRVPDRVTAHLLGDDDADPSVVHLVTEAVVTDVGDADLLARAITSGAALVYVRERSGGAGRSLAASGLAQAGVGVLSLDLARLSAGDDTPHVAAVALREARLTGAGLVAGPVEALAERGAGAVRAFAEGRGPLVLTGTRSWDPSWTKTIPFLVDALPLRPERREALWARALNGHAPGAVAALLRSTAQFRLTPEQVVCASQAALQQATALDAPLTEELVRAGARTQNSAGLERLARRIEPAATWDDVVLPVDVLAQLGELTARVRHRDTVLDAWGMGSPSRGRGITALFTGESGTGKTLAAEVIAHDLGLDLYVIDLSSVVDKYIGETEKNLDRIFAEADRVNGILLFDEADALFGKRSEVGDAHDRYANVEVAYLLQRMEHFDGLAILTSNLPANLDEAFTRRLSAILNFPAPEENDRATLWRSHLRPSVPISENVDFTFLARSFKLTGGSIRNVTLAAAFLSAATNRRVGMEELILATQREYRKLGRMCLADEFGAWISDVRPEPAPHAVSLDLRTPARSCSTPTDS